METFTSRNFPDRATSFRVIDIATAYAGSQRSPAEGSLADSARHDVGSPPYEARIEAVIVTDGPDMAAELARNFAAARLGELRQARESATSRHGWHDRSVDAGRRALDDVRVASAQVKSSVNAGRALAP